MAIEKDWKQHLTRLHDGHNRNSQVLYMVKFIKLHITIWKYLSLFVV